MNPGPDLTMATLKMILALALVLALLWVLHRWLKRAMPAGPGGIGGKERLISVLSNQPLGVKKSVALVRVPGKVLVLGIGSEQINLLAQIDDPEILADLADRQPRSGATRFSEHLQSITRGFRRSSDQIQRNRQQGGTV